MSADSYSSLETAPRRSGGFLRVMLAGFLLALLAAAALIGWLVWEGRIALPITRSGSVIFRGPEPAPDPNVTSSQQPQVNIVLERQVAELERRLARIDLQAAAAEGNTARAEALLVALATRRAVERGAPLGYLEQQLRQRFGAEAPLVAHMASGPEDLTPLGNSPVLPVELAWALAAEGAITDADVLERRLRLDIMPWWREDVAPAMTAATGARGATDAPLQLT